VHGQSCGKIEACRRYRASGQEQGVGTGVFPLVVPVTTTSERQAMLLNLLSHVPTRGFDQSLRPSALSADVEIWEN
jgi:hypothetical protein